MPPSDPPPHSVRTWSERGRFMDVGGRRIFLVEEGDPATPAVLILHGFPGSSHDWAGVVGALSDHARVVAFDMLGYGLSDKPTDARYSLFEQADLAEAVVAEAGLDRCAIVAHDMGDTVAAELLQRSVEGRLGFAVDRAILTNGSIFIDLAQLSDGQQLLLSLPDEPLTESLPMDGFRPALRETFSPDHPVSPDDEAAMLWLIANGDGDRLLPRLIRYIEERRANQERWTSGLVSYRGPLTLLWGELDPIAVPAMTDRLLELRPDTEVVTWGDVAHWPSIEVPQRLTEAIVERLEAAPGVVPMEGAE